MPITLLYFNGKRLLNSNLLTWATTFEKDNKEFKIERSENGTSFYTIGSVNGSNESNYLLTYSYEDELNYEGIMYYRLRQVDLDGKESFSNIVAISSAKNSVLNVYPNPTNGQVLLSLFTKELSGSATVVVYNTLGQALFTDKIEVIELSSGLTIDMTILPKGTYAVKVLTNEGEWVERLVKN